MSQTSPKALWIEAFSPFPHGVYSYKREPIKKLNYKLQ